MIQGTRITIERNGPVEYIRITALNGYEFCTNFSVTRLPTNPPPEFYDHADFSIMAPGKVDDPENDETPEDLPKIDGLILRNRNGTKLTPENADNNVFVPNDSIDNKDRWLYGGRYGVIGTEEPDEPFFLGYFIWATSQWFEMPIPQEGPLGDEEALTMFTEGVKRKRMMMWWSGKCRHVDLSTWDYKIAPTVFPPGIGISVGVGGSSKLTFISVANSTRAFRTGEDGEQTYSELWPLAGHSARQGEFVVACSWRGDDFQFEAKNEKYNGFDNSTSTFFSFIKPAWAFGEVLTQWHWRGDGKRCVSLQYGRTPRNPPLLAFEEVLDAGFVEADIVLYDEPDGVDEEGEPNGEGKPIIDTDLSGFHKSQHNLMSMGIHPVGIDYVMHDQRKKRAYYLKHYLGPLRVSAIPVEDEPDEFVNYRDILIYLVCTIIEDDVLDGLFPGTEQWKIPVWHNTFFRGGVPGVIDGDIGLPEAGFEMVNAAQAAIHPYRNIRGVITAMDLRADAIAVKYRCMMTYPHTIGDEDLASAPHFGKYWRIWGDVRQNTWINPDIASGVDPEDPNYNGFNPVYDWFNTDADVWEGADPPEPDPTLPPGDFFAYLDEPPAGYSLFTNADPAYSVDGAKKSLRVVQGVILGIYPYLGAGPGDFSPFRSYNYFAISPTRSFSLSSEVRSNHDHVSTDFGFESNPYGVPNPWNRFDYIEKNLGRGNLDENGEEVEEGTGVFEVLTGTHVELVNWSRDSDLEWLVVPEHSPEGDDLFNSAANMGIWVE